MSLTIFVCHVNDLEQELDDKGVNGIDIGMVKLLLLLYADDVFFFRHTPPYFAEELQKSFRILKNTVVDGS